MGVNADFKTGLALKAQAVEEAKKILNPNLEDDQKFLNLSEELPESMGEMI
jgi:hypothetical protein